MLNLNNHFRNKKGISLITVLLFMLVATIAATAVFKWLNSTGKSSASRLMQTEAGQAAQAGIETARSWMVHHAADLGAVIKQFKEGENAPISLNKVLTPMGGVQNQSFDVYLVEANTSKQPYQIKIISTGHGRGGSQYSQTAIFNVDGLYRVRVPGEETTAKVDFDYAYYGGGLSMSANYSGKNASMVVNGNWTGTPPANIENMVVTGDFKASNNKITVDGNLCVGGTYSEVSGDGGTYVSNLYVKGAAAINQQESNTSYGNVYFDGNVDPATGTIAGNVTLNGTLKTNLSGRLFTIGGNLVMTENGKIELDSDDRAFTVKGSVWMPGTNALYGRSSSLTGYKHILGDNDNIIFAAHSSNADNRTLNSPYYQYQTTATKAVYFKSKGLLSFVTGTRDFSGAEAVKDYCYDIWSEKSDKSGCNNSSFLVDDMLKTAYDTFEDYADKHGCDMAVSQYDTQISSSKINECWSNTNATNPENLYNGFLVVKFLSGAQFNNSDPLQGKFIFIYPNSEQIKLQKTANDGSMVMVYLKNGGTLTPNNCSGSGSLNYFIYSEKSVTMMNFQSPNCPITGTVYIPIEGGSNCNATATMNETPLISNQDLIQALANANILCDASATSCGGNSSSSTSGDEETTQTAGGELDVYYIPLSPRLTVTLQSQYTNKDIDTDALNATTSTETKASILVLPRIVYLPTNPVGKLEDYYSVLPLTGALKGTTAQAAKAGSVTSCTPYSGTTGTIPTNNALGTLTEGTYKCTFTSSATNTNGKTVPFWVKVKGNLNTGSPKVYFTESSYSLTGMGEVCYDVKLEMEQGSHTEDGEVTINIVSKSDADWTITPINGVSTGSNPSYTATVPPGNTTTVLKVCRTIVANSSAASLYLQLDEECDYCTTSTPNSLLISVAGSAIINREEVNVGTSGLIYNNTIDAATFAQFPSCDNYYDKDNFSWVSVSGDNCTENTKNDQWTCVTDDVTRLSININNPKNEACAVLNANHPAIVTDLGNVAYASIRLKPYTLTVNSNKSNQDITLTGTETNANHTNNSTVLDNSVLQNQAGFNGNGSAQVFYGLPYTINVNISDTERLSSVTCSPANSTSICNKIGEKTVNITPLAETTVDLKIVNLGEDCIERLDGFANWGYDCAGEVCAQICSSTNCSLNSIETGNENSDAGWVQFHYTKKDVVQNGSGLNFSDLTTSDNSMNRAILLKTNQGTTDGYMEATINIGDGKASPAFVFRANERATDYYTVWLYETSNSKYNAYLCNENYDGASSTNLPTAADSTVNGCSIITLSPELPTSSFSSNSDFTFAIEFIGTSLTVTLTQGGTVYEGSAVIGRAESSTHNRFGFAFYKHANKSFLGSFAVASLEADGSCELTGGGTTTPVLSCGTVPPTGTAGTAITAPTLTCSDGSTPSNISWFNAPTWSSPSANTYNNISVTATCGSTSNLQADCDGILEVSAIPPTLSCGTVPFSGTVGIAITPPTVTCSDNSTPTITNWTNAPDWSNPTANTYSNIKVTATCGSTSGLNADCDGSITVSSGTPNSCDFNQDWCPGIDWETGIKWGINASSSNAKGKCFFVTGQNQGPSSGPAGKVNQGDGGYYLYCSSDDQNQCQYQNIGNAKAKPSCTGPVLPPPTLFCGNVTKTIANGATLAQIGNINGEVSCEYGDVPIITGWSFDSSLEGTYYNPIVTATCGNTQNLTANCSGSVTVNPAGGGGCNASNAEEVKGYISTGDCMKTTCDRGGLCFTDWSNSGAHIKVSGGCTINDLIIPNSNGTVHCSNPGQVFIEVLSGSASQFVIGCW